MNPKALSILAPGLMAIAGGIVWKRMRDDTPPASEAAVASPAGKTSPRDESPHAGRPGAERTVESGKEAATAGSCDTEGDGQVAQWLGTASEAFEQTTSQLVTELGLSPAEAGEVREIFNRRERQLGILLAGTNPGETKDDREVFGKICALLRNKGLRDDLAGVLAPRQLEAFDAREAKRERDAIEARAYLDLAEINAVVRLTEAQKQAVFEALLEHAPEKLEMEADARAFMSLAYGPLAAGMDSSAVRLIAGILKADPAGTSDFDPESTEHLERTEKRKAERIENEIAALRGILEENQLARYRRHLASQPS